MNITCDTPPCTSLVMDQGGVQATVAVARAKGWHMYAGPSVTGKYIDIALCPACVSTNRSRLPAPPPVLQGQLELEFDNEGEEGTPPAA